MKHAIPALALIALIAIPAHALEEVVKVTVTSRKGLDFKLSAVLDTDGIVHVKMRLSKDSFNGFRSATLRIAKGDKTILSAPVATKRDAKGAILMSFDIALELANACYVDVSRMAGFGGVTHEIELKGFITKVIRDHAPVQFQLISGANARADIVNKAP